MKRIIKSVTGAKDSTLASYYPKLSQGLIPTDRTKQDLLFSVIGTD